MSAQTVKEVSVAEAKAFVAGGQQLGPGIFALKSKGITVTVKRTTDPARAKLIIVKGCAC
jgi:hypothetical protein